MFSVGLLSLINSISLTSLILKSQMQSNKDGRFGSGIIELLGGFDLLDHNLLHMHGVTVFIFFIS